MGDDPLARGTSRGPADRRPIVLAIGDAGADPRLAAALRDEGYDVCLAGSEREAADLMTARAMDCVILPFSAAEAAGRDAWLRLGSSTRILVTTPIDAGGLVARALDAGADDCAPLEGDLQLLKARLRALTRRKRGDDERTRRAVAESAATLSRKDAELAALTYAISHDLRAPLRAVDGFSRILLEEHGAATEQTQVSYLERIAAASREMSRLIDDLLQLSRIGRAELRRRPVDVSELARRVAGELRAKSGRAVEVVIQEGLVADADPRLLQAALEHLLGNSWKFTGPSEAPRIECRAQRAAGQTEFVVADNGVGFDASRAERLFQPFQRLHSGKEFEGTGIGLAVVRKIIDRHGGHVRAESGAGAGAAVFFTLPSAPEGDSSR